MAQIYGVDLGTSNIKMYSTVNDKILNEKNVLAIKDKAEIYAFGNRAYEMYEKAPSYLDVTFPIKNGVIADISNMEDLLGCFYQKMNRSRKVTPGHFCICVPTDVTDVEKRAFFDLIYESPIKTKKVTVVEKPLADAVGVGVDMSSPKGTLIANIGADTTEISVIAAGGLVVSKLMRIGGRHLDEAICNSIKRKYNLVIGSKTAEQLKIQLADALGAGRQSMSVYGIEIVSGLPTKMGIGADLIYESIQSPIEEIAGYIKVMLERVPREISADIFRKGIYLTGGSSQMRNLDEMIYQTTGLKVNKVQNPSETVVRGISKILTTRKYRKLMYVPREKDYD